jgi:eukaryotic-like serine/threonine-protein kinase
VNASQVEPLQQPVHEVVPPHEHTPAEHESPEPQAAHATPPVPQRVADCEDCATHALPLQHPVGHEVASQTHLPVIVSHSCPMPHAPHAAPPEPHDVFDSEANISQTSPLQQPRGQVDALQLPPPTSGMFTSFPPPLPSAGPSVVGTELSVVPSLPPPPSAPSSVASALASHPPVHGPSEKEPRPSMTPHPVVAPAKRSTASAQRPRTLEEYENPTGFTSNRALASEAPVRDNGGVSTPRGVSVPSIPGASLDGGPPSHLTPGYRLDRYELLCPIAEGGMASVWIARQTGKHGFRKLVAIKTILPRYAAEPKFQQMFIDEARIASRIEHVNVTQILDVGEQHGITYLVMEYVDGDALSKMSRAAQKKDKPIPLGVLLRILADTCAGLHAAHELKDEAGQSLGVIHRDVSPQNVLVTTKGVAKLIDFGIAKARGRLGEDTKTDQVKGKVAYMAPEQALGRSMDQRADVWSVGAVLYQLLVGKSPYEGESEIQTLLLMSSGRPPPPLPTSVPAPVAAIVRRTLSHSPEARYASAAELQEAIEKAMVEGGLVTTATQVAAFMADLMGDRAEKRKESIALGLKAADEREKLADIMQRNAEIPGPGSDSGVGTPSAGAAGARIVTASGVAPESQKSGSGQTLGGSAAMAVPTVEPSPPAEARSGRGRTFAVVAGIAVVAVAAAVAVVATRKPEPGAAATDHVPSASAPAASTTVPAASASSATAAVDAAPSSSAAATAAAPPRPAVRWVPPTPAPTPKPTPTPAPTGKTRDNYGF